MLSCNQTPGCSKVVVSFLLPLCYHYAGSHTYVGFPGQARAASTPSPCSYAEVCCTSSYWTWNCPKGPQVLSGRRPDWPDPGCPGGRLALQGRQQVQSAGLYLALPLPPHQARKRLLSQEHWVRRTNSTPGSRQSQVETQSPRNELCRRVQALPPPPGEAVLLPRCLLACPGCTSETPFCQGPGSAEASSWTPWVREAGTAHTGVTRQFWFSCGLAEGTWAGRCRLSFPVRTSGTQGGRPR